MKRSENVTVPGTERLVFISVREYNKHSFENGCFAETEQSGTGPAGICGNVQACCGKLPENQEKGENYLWLKLP